MNEAAGRERERESQRQRQREREVAGKGEKRKMKHRSQGGTCLTGPRCHPEKACQRAAREWDSVWPLHRNGQDVWTQLSTSQTPLDLNFLHCQHVKADLQYWQRQNVCMPACRTPPDYLCTSTGLYLPVRLTALLSVSVGARQCLDTCLDVYILIKERCMLWYAHECEPGLVYLCVCVMGVWRRRRKVACGKLASLRAACCLNLHGCQRKLWSEESANRAWGMSPETRIIWNPETTAGSHLRGPVLKCRPRLSVRVSFPLGSPISWAPSVRVPSCTVGHLLILDAL